MATFSLVYYDGKPPSPEMQEFAYSSENINLNRSDLLKEGA